MERVILPHPPYGAVASAEVLKRGFDRLAFLVGKAPALCSIYHDTKNAQKALDPSVTILQHANRIIETAIGLCANLNCHSISLYFSRPLNCHSPDSDYAPEEQYGAHEADGARNPATTMGYFKLTDTTVARGYFSAMERLRK